MNKLELGLQGRYKFIATKEDGSQRVLSDWQDNLILDGGLDRIGVGSSWDRCQVGTGSTAPANGQTALSSLLASTTSVTAQTAGTNSPTNTYAWARRTYRFDLGAAAGNLAEVGVGWSGGLFSRALIKDELGNPTTITVLSDEYLDVIYEIRAYPVMTDSPFVVNINGTNHTFTVRPARLTGDQTSVGDWPWDLAQMMSAGVVGTGTVALGMSAYGSGASLGAVTDIIGGTQVVSSSSSSGSYRSSYANGSHLRECRMTFGLGAGSVPFGGFFINTYAGTYQMTVSPTIPKDSTKVFTLDFTLSWARKSI